MGVSTNPWGPFSSLLSPSLFPSLPFSFPSLPPFPLKPWGVVRKLRGVLNSLTNSSAVAETLREALCQSVVSLNKIITRAESFIIVTEASDLLLHNIVFGVTLRLLVIHLVVVSCRQQTQSLISD